MRHLVLGALALLLGCSSSSSTRSSAEANGGAAGSKKQTSGHAGDATAGAGGVNAGAGGTAAGAGAAGTGGTSADAGADGGGQAAAAGGLMAGAGGQIGPLAGAGGEAGSEGPADYGVVECNPAMGNALCIEVCAEYGWDLAECDELGRFCICTHEDPNDIETPRCMPADPDFSGEREDLTYAPCPPRMLCTVNGTICGPSGPQGEGESCTNETDGIGECQRGLSCFAETCELPCRGDRSLPPPCVERGATRCVHPYRVPLQDITGPYWGKCI